MCTLDDTAWSTPRKALQTRASFHRVTESAALPATPSEETAGRVLLLRAFDGGAQHLRLLLQFAQLAQQVSRTFPAGCILGIVATAPRSHGVEHTRGPV